MAELMRWELFLNKDGTTETNVLERQDGVSCNKIRQFTDGLGRELNDEQTGPECDDIREIQH